MNTQLILYPQNYNGVYNSTFSYSTSEFITNGQNFVGLNQSSDAALATTGYPAVNVVNQISPGATLYSSTLVGGVWHRFHTIGPYYDVTTAPTKQAGNILFPITTTTSNKGYSGLLQRIDNLVPGNSYTISIKTASPLPSGTVILDMLTLDGQLHVGDNFINPMYLTYTMTFTALYPSEIIAIVYESDTATHVIKTISMVDGSVTATLDSVSDGQVICDLYEEEAIPLTLSVDDFKNVAEQVKSYSKDFNLPATKRNNQIFNNMFEVTRRDDGIIFNPYVKTKCALKQDGFILFEGYLRMINVKDDKGEISYNVNLYSEVIAVADALKEVTFAELDFTELTHDYNKSQIKNTWTGAPTYLNPNTSGFRTTETLKYPFIDWTHQYLLGGTNANAATVGHPELTSLEQAFRPCIQLKYLINKIFANTSFNWTSNFFDSAEFEKLYMDFNWGSNEFGSEPELGTYGDVSLTPIYSTTSYQTVPLDDENFSSDIGWSSVNNRFTATNDNSSYSIQWMMSGSVLSGMGNLTVRWAQYNSGGTFLQQYDYSSTTYPIGLAIPTVSGHIYALLQSGDYLQLEFKTDVASKFVITLTGPLTFFLVTIGSLVATTNTFLQTLRGELGQWDFLKGIMTMFNLVSMVDESKPNTILIEPYPDIFITNADSKELDWTQKIDISEMELIPLTDLNKTTTFKFTEDDEDYATGVYKNATSGHLYGSLIHDASGFTILKGEKKIIAEPFAATLSKPLDAQFSVFIVPQVYARNDDGTFEGFDNAPRIFYNNGSKSTGASFYIPPQNGESSENQTEFLQFSHLSQIPTTTSSLDFVFASSQIPAQLGSPPVSNLYNLYWSPYFNELYNADTRIMTLRVNLTPGDIATFKFYDTVFIKNRTFRVNKIEYKPNELAKVEFILIP